ncbi:hypothetical protein SteCoe_22319 [Stentor coeruleus]|uniref:Uncharacterized protein n=1 Tax=Stentor coeruleus TaxID=5963 RepID=A0A1R2BN20_9CILI|nr:hypothetical protein SteCoe_22319 [Stentor coeruleus]
MSALPKSLALGLIFCGTIGGAIMNNIYSKVSNYRIAYLCCRNYWDEAQKYKIESFSFKYRIARRKAFYCVVRKLNKLSKEESSDN